MALRLFKPGQGYWVRVLTATLLGVVTLATSAWVWGQSALLVSSLPKSAVEVTLRNVEGTAPGAGTLVNLVAPGDAGAERTIGTAEVAAYDAANGFMRLRRVSMADPGTEPSAAKGVAVPGGVFKGEVWGLMRSVSAVDPMYIQGGAATLILLLGALVTYYFAASNPRTVDFLIATDGEMKKVNWSTWKDIKGSTAVVIFSSFLIASLLFGFDLFFKEVFQGIGVLVD